MAGRRKESLRWFEIFPVEEALATSLKTDPKDVLIVDIGGSHGHDLIRLKENHPNLAGRFVLQDLPETVNSIPSPFPEIEPMIHDFFTPQPIIGKCTTTVQPSGLH